MIYTHFENEFLQDTILTSKESCRQYKNLLIWKKVFAEQINHINIYRYSRIRLNNYDNNGLIMVIGNIYIIIYWK